MTETKTRRNSKADIESRVKKIIVESLCVPDYEVTPKSNLHDDLGADSLDAVELVMSFEEEFDIEIPDDDAMAVMTVEDAVKCVQKFVRK